MDVFYNSNSPTKWYLSSFGRCTLPRWKVWQAARVGIWEALGSIPIKKKMKKKGGQGLQTG